MRCVFRLMNIETGSSRLAASFMAALAAGVATGFHFAPVATDMLVAAIERARSVWREPQLWRRLQRNAMQTDVGWRGPAKHYASLYRELMQRQRR